MLAKDSQYATSCQLESEEELPVLAVSALISEPFSLPSSSPSPYLRERNVLIIVNFLTIFPGILQRGLK